MNDNRPDDADRISEHTFETFAIGSNNRFAHAPWHAGPLLRLEAHVWHYGRVNRRQPVPERFRYRRRRYATPAPTKNPTSATYQGSRNAP
jgi:hypothetical protein